MEYILPAALINGMVFGIICALVANHRGHSGRAGFLWGFAFGIVGLIFVSIEKDSKLITQRNQVALGEMKTCSCGNVVSANSTICPVCGKNISQVAPSLAVFDRFHPQFQFSTSQRILAIISLMAGIFSLIAMACQIIFTLYSLFIATGNSIGPVRVNLNNVLSVFIVVLGGFIAALSGFLSQLHPRKQKIQPDDQNIFRSATFGMWLGIAEILFLVVFGVVCNIIQIILTSHNPYLSKYAD